MKDPRYKKRDGPRVSIERFIEDSRRSSMYTSSDYFRTEYMQEPFNEGMREPFNEDNVSDAVDNAIKNHNPYSEDSVVEFTVGGRQCGKTSKMVEWVRHQPGTRLILVSDVSRRRIMCKMFPDIAHCVVTIQDMKKRRGYNKYNIAIDDLLDCFMEQNSWMSRVVANVVKASVNGVVDHPHEPVVLPEVQKDTSAYLKELKERVESFKLK